MLICALVAYDLRAAEGMYCYVEDKRASYLDGSPYVFYLYQGNTSEWSIGIRGGGWCLTEESVKCVHNHRWGARLGTT